MPKKKAKQDLAPKAPMTKRELSRWQKEKRQERIALIAVVTVIAFVAGILLFGFWREVWSRPGQVVARVGNAAITLGRLEQETAYRAKVLDKQIELTNAQVYEYKANAQSGDETASYLVQYIEQQLQQLQMQRVQLGYGTSVLEELIENELIKQEVVKRGGQVTAADVDAQVRLQYQPTPEPTAVLTDTASITATANLTPAPTATAIPEDAWKSNLANTLAAYEITEADFRKFTMEPSVWRSKLTALLGDTIATTAEQVHARHILVATEDEARSLLTLLKEQKSTFEELAAASSTDTQTKDQGGDLGWFARGTMAAEFEAAAFALEPGQISEPISTTYGFHIIRVEEKDANRALSTDQLETARSTAFSNWLTTATASSDIQRSLDADKQTWLNKQIPEALFY